MFQRESFGLRLGTLGDPRQLRREKYVRGLEAKNWNTLGHGNIMETYDRIFVGALTCCKVEPPFLRCRTVTDQLEMLRASAHRCYLGSDWLH
jgi:hypothetical protein